MKSKLMTWLLILALGVSLFAGVSLPAAATPPAKVGVNTTVSIGGAMMGAILSDGSVAQWGRGEYGEITYPPNLVSLSIGCRHAGGITANGELWMWAIARRGNDCGQLGDGTTDDHDGNPVKVMDDVAAVNCSYSGNNSYSDYTAVIKKDGSLWTFGNNNGGQLGQGADLDHGSYSSQPNPVKILDDVVSVSCGKDFAAAVTEDGGLWVWGILIHCGDIQDEFALETGGLLTPTRVMDDVADVACSSSAMAIIKNDGSLWTAGWNYGGQLGQGLGAEADAEQLADAGLPADAGLLAKAGFAKVLDNVKSVSIGGNTTYASGMAALKTDGTLWTWGCSPYIGNGAQGNDTQTTYYKEAMPIQTVPVKIMDDVAAMDFSRNYGRVGLRGAALKNDGSLWTWGDVSNGSLGYDDGDMEWEENGGATHFPIQTVPRLVTSGIVLPDGTKTTPLAPVSPFSDVPADAYYADAVAWAFTHGVTTGTTDTTFSPLDTVTRAQVVTFLWRAMNEPEPEAVAEVPFNDIDPNEYYYKPILWAVQNGITNGTGDGAFSPHQTCLRAHIITFLYRTMGEPGKTESPEWWYADAVNWANGDNLLSGTALAFEPEADCPRADVVYYLWRELA